MRLVDLVSASERVASTRSRKRKIGYLADLLRRASNEETPVVVAYLSGELPQGRIGLGAAAFRALSVGSAPSEPHLTVADAHRAFDEIAAASGRGAASDKKERLGRLYAGATEPERSFLTRLVLGGLRQGALEGVMLEALGVAFEVDAAEVRRAAMLAGSIPSVAEAVARDGRAGLSAFALTVFRPVLPMLASPADDVEAALGRLGDAAFELKLDGARVQIHKSGGDVRVFSRGLHDVTSALPELVADVGALPVRELILDGETIALRPDGTPRPFQSTMRRFGRRLDVARMRAELPLTTYVFDCMLQDGEALLDEPLRRRAEVTAAALPSSMVVPRKITDRLDEATHFFERATELGHEGLVAKSLDAPYEAGARGSSWLKVKPAHSLDLVVLAAEWGSGRRRGWLSNLHLGARDPVAGGFVMLGKTFKGMTDQVLAWQTEQLLARELARDGHVVYVKPELVAQIAFSDVQTSPHYPGGMALRFARLSCYRTDKSASDADTIDAVRALHARADRGGGEG